MQEIVKPYPRLLDWLRYLCAFLLFMYGASKLAHLQFDLQSKLSQRRAGSLNGYELTWFYYGYSRSYASILGFLQILGATLLLFRKSALLGAALVTPMMANILLINVFYLVGDYGPQITSTFICVSMLILLGYQRTTLLSLFWATQPADQAGLHRWIRALIPLAVLLIVGLGSFIQRHYERVHGSH